MMNLTLRKCNYSDHLTNRNNRKLLNVIQKDHYVNNDVITQINIHCCQKNRHFHSETKVVRMETKKNCCRLRKYNLKQAYRRRQVQENQEMPSILPWHSPCILMKHSSYILIKQTVILPVNWSSLPRENL